MKIATHVYVVSVQCGCVAAMFVDDECAANDVHDYTRDGYIVTRMPKGDEMWHRCVKHMGHGHNEWRGAMQDQRIASLAARVKKED